MSTSTTVHSNAFNFMSFILNQVDPRTGQYTCAISLPELKANDLCGPVVPLQLNFNPLNPADSGFGKGWNLQLSQFNPINGVLSLYTGETFKVNLVNGEADIPERKIDSFHFKVIQEGSKTQYRVAHKSGLVEVLEVGQGEFALPVKMLSPQGHHVTLDYVPFGTDPLLSRISNADGTLLLSLERTTNTLQLRLHPGSALEALFEFSIIGGETTSIVLPTLEKASWRFGYTPLNGLTCLKDVYTPTGGHETVSYSGTPHSFPGLNGRKLPRVESHKRDPGFEQPVIETRYEYDTSGQNFLGFGSGVAWSDDGLDNLYQDNVPKNYTYETTEILWDALAPEARRTTRRVFNRFHLMVLEETSQKAQLPEQDDTWLQTDIEYHINLDLPFKDQQAYCQLPKTNTQTWRNAAATLPRHTEKVETTYDDFGNVLSQINANGVTEVSEWYTAEAQEGCPKDPEGFVRNLKSKTVTPALSDYGVAPQLSTVYHYSEQAGLAGTGPWLAMSDEILTQRVKGQETELQRKDFQYISTPDSSFEHGRKQQDAVTLNRKTTRTEYAYSKTPASRANPNCRAEDTVLHTDSTLIGFDDYVFDPAQPDKPENRVRKVVTLEHSLLNGEPLLNRDDNDVEIAYEYDLLGRVTKETVAPGTDYVASRNYSYTLTNAVGQQAQQTAIDVKGVETITWLDGLNRVLQETRRDADALGGNPEVFRETYRATYNNLEQLTSETVIDWEGASDVPLLSLFNYDDWGEQRSVIRPDGLEEHEMTDPITRTTTQWLEGMGQTITVNNLFDKPDRIKRIDLSGKQISEHLYYYDGMGRTAEEYDAAGNWTRYEYDGFDRMTKTLLPDSNVVEREYAGHSGEDLPVKISVNGVVLGEQGFDGLDRMVLSITGGRESHYSYSLGQTQPKSVKRPTGFEIGYVYRPELGEDPEQRIAVERIANYTYDSQTARLSRTEETDEAGIQHSLVREYFNNGELKSEHHKEGVEEKFAMHYEYSRQARLMSYTDVLGNIQRYQYDHYARLIKTSLDTTSSTFTYDHLGQIKGIETLEGEQRLKIDLEYDDFGREVLRTFNFSHQVSQTLSQTWDEVDRLTRRELKQGTEMLRQEDYVYDERGRLIQYDCAGSQPPEDPYGKLIKSQLFGFDALDNIDFVETTFEGGRNSSYHEYTNQDDPCQLTAITHTWQPDYPARIEFTYDQNGNLLQDEAGRQLAYDSLDRLISVSTLPRETASN